MRPNLGFAALMPALALGCGSGGMGAVFHRTDPHFRASAGAAPRVYFERDLDAVPSVGLHSVGLIVVRVPSKRGPARAAALAVEKGRELGCWLLIEHSAFATLQTSTSLTSGARIFLAHGSAEHAAPVTAALKIEFDCVVQNEGSQAAFF